MLADGRGGAAESVAAPALVVAVAALDFEAQPLQRYAAAAPAAGAARLNVTQSGPGPERAAAAATATLAAGAEALLSFGVAGALTSELEPGTVLVPRELRCSSGPAAAIDAAWQAAIAAALRTELRVSEAPLLSSDVVLDTPARKARAAAESAAAAVDMESAAIAAVAARAGAPFVAVRVVVDAAGDVLPPGTERWVDAAGNRRHFAALEAAVRPREWRHLWLLAQRYRAATRTLDRLAARLAPAGFLFAAPR